MYKHILLPTDGTAESADAIQQCMKLAKSVNAKVTGLHVIPEYHLFTYHAEMLEDTREQFAIDSREHAKQYLAVIEMAAKEAGVSCDTGVVTSDHPYEAIIEAAAEKGCDLIAMASHGRKGVKGLLISSETQKVLTHSKIPVLVYR